MRTGRVGAWQTVGLRLGSVPLLQGGVIQTRQRAASSFRRN